MKSMPECQMRIRVWRAVESTGIGKLRGVVVRRADHRQHQLSGGNRLAVHLKLLPRLTIHPLQRRAISQYFLDRGGEQLGARAQQRELVGMFHKAEHRAIHKIGGGLTAGKKQELEEAEDLAVREPL